MSLGAGPAQVSLLSPDGPPRPPGGSSERTEKHPHLTRRTGQTDAFTGSLKYRSKIFRENECLGKCRSTRSRARRELVRGIWALAVTGPAAGLFVGKPMSPKPAKAAWQSCAGPAAPSRELSPSTAVTNCSRSTRKVLGRLTRSAGRHGTEKNKERWRGTAA